MDADLVAGARQARDGRTGWARRLWRMLSTRA